MDTLDKQQKKVLYAFEEACNWMDSLVAEDAFANGFRLDARLMAEVLDDDALPG